MLTANATPILTPVWREKQRRDPRMPPAIASVSVTLSAMAMSLLGMPSILLFYALWLSRVLYRGNITIRPSPDSLLVLSLAAYGILSTLWSAHPPVTLRATVQFASIILCALIMSRIVRTESIIRGVSYGILLAIFVMVAISSGKPPHIAAIHYLGSKNQLGVLSEIGLIAALFALFTYHVLWKRLLISFPLLLFYLVALIKSESGTSNISLAGAIVFATAVSVISTRVPRRIRTFALSLCVVLIAMLCGVGLANDLDKEGLRAMGKSTTLTGRTVLWDEGISQAMNNPYLGVGAGAFWVHGNPVAEKMWSKFGIASRSGFHFHNLFINLFVDLGVVGLILWLAVYLSVFLKCIAHVLKLGPDIESVFYLTVTTMFVIRSFTESDTPGPYGVGPLLFFLIVFKVNARAKLNRGIDAARRSGGHPHQNIPQTKK